MATVTQPFLARNRRFEVGDEVADGDPLVADYPHLFGVESGRTVAGVELSEFGPADDDEEGDG